MGVFYKSKYVYEYSLRKYVKVTNAHIISEFVAYACDYLRGYVWTDVHS